MLNRGHTIIAVCGACAAIIIASAPTSWANAPSGRRSGAVSAHRPQPGSALTKTQLRALAEIQQGAVAAGLHPGVFGPQEAATAVPVVPHLVTRSGGFDWDDAGIGAAGTLALTLIGCGAALTAMRHRNHRVHD